MAETREEASSRILNALNEIAEEAKENGESNVLAVTSSGTIFTLLPYLGVEGSNTIDSGSVTILYYNDGEFTVGVIGDSSYADLGAEVRTEYTD